MSKVLMDRQAGILSSGWDSFDVRLLSYATVDAMVVVLPLAAIRFRPARFAS